MDLWQTLYFLLSSFVRQLPELIVVVIGIIICFTNLKKFPKAGKIALGGLFILFVSLFLGLGMTLLFIYLPLWYRDSYQNVGYITFAVGIIFSIIRAAGLGLITYAIWVERESLIVN